MGSLSRPGSLIFILILESIILKESLNALKTAAVLACILGIICTIQPWTDHDDMRRPECEATSLIPLKANQSISDPHLTANIFNTGSYQSHDTDSIQESIRENNKNISDSNSETNTAVRHDCDHVSMYNPLKGYICITINILSTVAILIYHKNTLCDQNVSILVFWAFLIGSPLSAAPMLIFEHDNLSVDWTMETILLVLANGIGASSLTMFSLLANQITSSLIVQLTSSLHIIMLLVGQYTLLKDINPGHQNLMEILGVCVVFIGSGLIPILMHFCEKK